MSAEVSGLLPGLSPILAERHINYAWRDVRDSFIWSFLLADGAVVCPAQITTGTFAITQFGTTVTANAAASAALAAVSASIGLTNLQIRFGQVAPAKGQVYNINDVAEDSPPTAYVLTLDRPVQEGTAAASTYQVYRCYIKAPVEDFLSWWSMTDLTNGWALWLNRSSWEFDIRDPRRAQQSVAKYCGIYRGAQTNADSVVIPNPNAEAQTNVYELWPHPTGGQLIYQRYRRRGTELSDPSDVLPPIIPEQLVITRALFKYSYPFAKANVQNFPTLANANWTDLITTSMADYERLLALAWSNDNESALQYPTETGEIQARRSRRSDA